MFCRKCKYPLANIPTLRCPECGKPFNPIERGTFLRTRHERAQTAFTVLVIGVMGALIGLLILLLVWV